MKVNVVDVVAVLPALSVTSARIVYWDPAEKFEPAKPSVQVGDAKLADMRISVALPKPGVAGFQ